MNPFFPENKHLWSKLNTILFLCKNISSNPLLVYTWLTLWGIDLLISSLQCSPFIFPTLLTGSLWTYCFCRIMTYNKCQREFWLIPCSLISCDFIQELDINCVILITFHSPYSQHLLEYLEQARCLINACWMKEDFHSFKSEILERSERTPTVQVHNWRGEFLGKEHRPGQVLCLSQHLDICWALNEYLLTVQPCCRSVSWWATALRSSLCLQQ